jgi:acyl-CoA reductase-like NAD-dependent aldehyde dehydrogenase
MSTAAQPTAPSQALQIKDPASGRGLGAVTLTAPQQVGDIASEVAHVQPLWALLRIADRARYIARISQAIIDQFDELAGLLSHEQGRPRGEVAALELLAAIDSLHWIATRGPQTLGVRGVRVHRSMFPLGAARIVYEPLNVVGVIGSGSAPFAQPISQIAGVLLAGGGVIYKPGGGARLVGERMAELLSRAELPDGLVRVLHGDGQLGRALIASPVQRILFTGTRASARGVALGCAEQEKEAVLESGGKDAMLVLADAHLPNALSAAIWAACAGAGQARGALKRIYLAREISAQFLTRLTQAMGELVVGDPQDPRVQVGPLASQKHLANAQALVAQAVSEGAQLLCGGPLEGSVRADAPAFYAPSVLSDVSPQMRLLHEPLQAPVLAVITIDEIEQALSLINDSEYGLGASVWGANRQQTWRLARELRAGAVWINEHLPGPMIGGGSWGAATPARLGRTLGESGLRACAQEKLISWSPPTRGGMWRGPYDQVQLQATMAVARLRSMRETDRAQIWRHGALAIARTAGRALVGR